MHRLSLRAPLAVAAGLATIVLAGAGLLNGGHAAVAANDQVYSSPSPSAAATTVVATATTATATVTSITPTATPTTPTVTPTTPAPTATTPAAPTQSANAPIHLTLMGANEVPTVTTTATGTFLATPGSDSLAFTLTVTGTGLTMGHIHLGAPGTNGPVIAFLYGPVAAPGVSSISISGTITAANLVGPMQGKTMADFFAAMTAGNLYVNAHTVANPAGEVRAWIPGTPKAPATGSGAQGAASASLFFILASVAGVVALASVSTMALRRRR